MPADPSAMTVALPLQGEGRIVCVTCHDPHARLAAAAREQHPGQLRMSNLKRELCLNCHSPDGQGGGVVEVTIPPAGAITSDEYIPLLGRARGMGVTHLEVAINGATFPLPLQRGVFRTRLRLQDGLNRVELRAAEKTVWSGEVYKSTPGSPAESYGRVYYGHQTASLDECLECHEGSDGSFTAVTGTTPGLCYRCHEPLDSKRFLHGPLAVGECLSCHDPHGGIGPSHLRKNEVALCLTCHDAGQVQDHEGWEQAMADDACSTCHDPHQSDTRFLVKEARL
jgi:predicted CXXCH cytochrome family protein